MEKLPPVEKVYEAWTALVDDRYDLSPEALIVRSSDGSKEYRVTWDDEGRYRSNDNATFWQGYAGYPVIMALMLQGRVPFNGEVAAWFKGIPWKALNDAHKRDYAAALAEAFERAGLDMPRQLQAEEAAAEVMEALRELPVSVRRPTRRYWSGRRPRCALSGKEEPRRLRLTVRAMPSYATWPGHASCGRGRGPRRRPRRRPELPRRAAHRWPRLQSVERRGRRSSCCGKYACQTPRWMCWVWLSP